MPIYGICVCFEYILPRIYASCHAWLLGYLLLPLLLSLRNTDPYSYYKIIKVKRDMWQQVCVYNNRSDSNGNETGYVMWKMNIHTNRWTDWRTDERTMEAFKQIRCKLWTFVCGNCTVCDDASCYNNNSPVLAIAVKRLPLLLLHYCGCRLNIAKKFELCETTTIAATLQVINIRMCMYRHIHTYVYMYMIKVKLLWCARPWLITLLHAFICQYHFYCCYFEKIYIFSLVSMQQSVCFTKWCRGN